MDVQTEVIPFVLLVLFVLALVQLVRFGWRFWRDYDQMEPGGSFGRQFRRDKTPKRRNNGHGSE